MMVSNNCFHYHTIASSTTAGIGNTMANKFASTSIHTFIQSNQKPTSLGGRQSIAAKNSTISLQNSEDLQTLEGRYISTVYIITNICKDK